MKLSLFDLTESTTGRASRISRLARIASLLAFLLVALAPASAMADGEVSRLNIDWDKLSDAIRKGEVALFPREHPYVRTGAPSASSQQERWFGVSPHLSLVARDWGGSQLLLGHASVTDIVRLSRSSRMVVSRLRLADGRLAPFTQIGIGQWRTDTDLMPVLPRDTELAAQFGGGFEFRVAHGCELALEMDYTILYREEHEPQHVPVPRIWGAFLATRAHW